MNVAERHRHPSRFRSYFVEALLRAERSARNHKRNAARTMVDDEFVGTAGQQAADQCKRSGEMTCSTHDQSSNRRLPLLIA
jgi:hypothetical protein